MKYVIIAIIVVVWISAFVALGWEIWVIHLGP
jgi:hypothetical protein